MRNSAERSTAINSATIMEIHMPVMPQRLDSSSTPPPTTWLRAVATAAPASLYSCGREITSTAFSNYVREDDDNGECPLQNEDFAAEEQEVE